MLDVIEIPLSKTKIVLALGGSVIFVAFGIAFIIYPEPFVSPIIRSVAALGIVGIAAVLFFGFCSIFAARKLFDKKIGLRIDQNGITDNSGATSIGLIEWADIDAIDTIQISSTKLLMIQTGKPEKYIDRAKSVISKQIMKTNLKWYGSPLSISTVSLKVKFDDLEKLLTEEFRKRKL